VAELLIRAPEPGDAHHIATHLRTADLVECRAAGQPDVHKVLADGVTRSLLCWTITVDGEPGCMMGVAPLRTLLDDVGVPWMLGTDLIPQHRRAFMRTARPYILKMLGAFPHLLNFVHAENTTAVDWLRRMGFEVMDAQPYGPHRALFHRFEAHVHVHPNPDRRDGGKRDRQRESRA
jgi:hypothetical protein